VQFVEDLGSHLFFVRTRIQAEVKINTPHLTSNDCRKAFGVLIDTLGTSLEDEWICNNAAIHVRQPDCLMLLKFLFTDSKIAITNGCEGGHETRELLFEVAWSIATTRPLKKVIDFVFNTIQPIQGSHLAQPWEWTSATLVYPSIAVAQPTIKTVRGIRIIDMLLK
jgi:hypothetical protein